MYLAGIDNPDHRDRTEEVLSWSAINSKIRTTNQSGIHQCFCSWHIYYRPFQYEASYECITQEVGITQFTDDIAQVGYSATNGLFRIPWNEPVNYELLEKMISRSIIRYG